MTTRIGKIAQLPKSIRDELNHRLENGQQSPELLRWLNNHPKTKKFLTEKFEGRPITSSNLCHWRHGGFQDWRADQAREARIQRITESGASLERAEGDDLFENFARLAVAELAVDLDALQKLRGETRSDRLHKLIRDLARLQNAFNRSRWAALAWTKYNDTYDSGTGVPPVCSQLETGNSKPETPNVTSTAPTSVAPNRTQLQAVDSRDSQPKEPYDPVKVVHHTKCACGEPCPKCHASNSEYPLDEVLRDRKFYKENNGRSPCDRHGRPKYLMNCDCDCPCDRCAENSGTGVPPVRSEPGRVVLPRDLISPHAESRDKTPATNSNPQPLVSPFSSTLNPLSDFLRKMAHLKSISR